MTRIMGFDKTSNTKDALANPLVIGNTYGYSVASSGRTSTVVGTLKSIGDSLATLDIIQRKHFLYGQEHTLYGSDAKTVSVQSCKLFPVTL